MVKQSLLQVCTYNMRGFKTSKVSYISDLISSFSIVFLVEHWLSNKQLSDLSGYSIHAVSAINDNVLLHGRPSGGCAVLYPDCYNKNAKLIVTKSNRLCAIRIESNNKLMYCFCVYMPCDINDLRNIAEYESILLEISTLCIKHSVQYMCLLGDMNTELSRCTSKTLTRFIEHESLYITLNHSCADVSYTCCNSHNNVFSTIDYIFISQNLCDYVVKYCSLCDEIDNQSDHVPLVLAINIVSETEHMKVSTEIHAPRKVWNRTNSEHINDYRMRLDDCLLSFTLPFDCLQCTDLVCTNNEHVESVQILHGNIIS